MYGMSMNHLCIWCPVGPEGDVSSSEAGFTEGCEPSRRCWTWVFCKNASTLNHRDISAAFAFLTYTWFDIDKIISINIYYKNLEI